MSLKGSLETVGLAEVLQFLASTGKTGEFLLAASSGEGRLWFEGGSISGVDAGDSREAYEAIFELLRLEGGDFEFSAGALRPGEAVVVSEADGEVGTAIERAEARLAEWRDIVAVVPSTRHWLRLSTSLPCEEVTLQASQWSLVGTVGSGCAVSHVLTERGWREFDGCKIVKELVDAHLVCVEEPVAEEPPAVAEDAEIDQVSDLGVGEARDPDAAEGSELWMEAERAAVESVAAEPWDEAGSAKPWDEAGPAEPAVDEAPVAGADQDPWSDSSHYDALKAAIAEVGVDGPDPSWWAATTGSEGDGVGYEGVVPGVADFGAETTRDPYDPDSVLEDPYIVGTEGENPVEAGIGAEAGIEAAATGEAGAGDHPVDGLADRGPWTSGELAEIGAWEQAAAGVSDAPAGDAAADVEPEPEPEEQPINRGLLLKFLSSVRD